MFWRSLGHPQGELSSLLKTICYRKIVVMVELQSKKCSICGCFTELFTIIETIQARCYDLKFVF
jgi:hypothetical protein